MKFNENIDLFKISKIVVERFRKESGFNLNGNEFRFEFKRDWNCPTKRINFNLLIFGENYTHSRFDEQYNTEEKVVELFFVHLRDDAGVQNLKDGLISAKRYSMETRVKKLSNLINELSANNFGAGNKDSLTTMIGEKYPYGETYENGFPIMQYQVYNQSKTIKKYFDLDFYMREFREKDIYNEIKEIITTSNNR